MSVHPGSIWLDENWAEVPKEIWVAATGEGIIVKDTDLVRLYATLLDRPITLSNVVVTYLPKGIRQ